MDTIVELAPSIIYGAILLFLLGAVATLWARMGNVQGELGGLKAEVIGLKTEVAGLRTSTDDRFANLEAKLESRTDGLRGAVEEVVKTQHEMQLQAQRNHHQVMAAILSHSHRADGGVHFDLPPDFEPTRAGDD